VSGTVALPSDFLQQRALYIASTDQPDYEPPQRYFGETQQYSWSQPVTFTITGTTLNMAGSYSGDVSLVYYKKYPDLTPGAPSHALMVAYPMVWLYALLIEANVWSRNDAAVTRWVAQFEGLIDGLNNTASKQRFGGPSQVVMRIDPIG
jgi:hypothetical protein